MSSAETSSHERPPSPTTTSDSPGLGCGRGRHGDGGAPDVGGGERGHQHHEQDDERLDGVAADHGGQTTNRAVSGSGDLTVTGWNPTGPAAPARLPLPIVDDSTLTTLAIAAAVVALLALALAVGAQLRLRGVRRDFAALGDDGTTDIARVAANQNRRIDRLTAEVARLREHVASAEDDVRQSLRNVAVVRYDAFGDMGGRLSLLGRDRRRRRRRHRASARSTPAASRAPTPRASSAASSSITLTPEEQQALASATGEPGRGPPRPPARPDEGRVVTPPRTPDELHRFGYLGPRAPSPRWRSTRGTPPRAASTCRSARSTRRSTALRAGDIDAAMVPIENSVEGGVSATLDALATGDPLVVIGEVLVPITFVLCARPGMPLADVRTVGTHPHAWAQVRGWMGAAPARRRLRADPVDRRERRDPRAPGT